MNTGPAAHAQKLERKVCFILDAGNQGVGWGVENWMSHQKLTSTPPPPPKIRSKKFYIEREGATCRNSTVSSDSHVHIGCCWSDQCHLNCFRHS